MKSASKPLTAEQQKLVEENMWCVRSIALRLRRRLPRHVMLEDLISAGYLGLVECAPRYDGRCLFHSFARHRILGAMRDYMRGEDLLTRTERLNGDLIERREVPVNPESLPASVRSVQKLEAGIEARRLIGKLNRTHPRRAFVAEQHFLQDRTLIAIGRRLGVTESRASQICSKAIAQMRAAA